PTRCRHLQHQPSCAPIPPPLHTLLLIAPAQAHRPKPLYAVTRHWLCWTSSFPSFIRANCPAGDLKKPRPNKSNAIGSPNETAAAPTLHACLTPIPNALLS